jgi:hypothetical protein
MDTATTRTGEFFSPFLEFIKKPAMTAHGVLFNQLDSAKSTSSKLHTSIFSKNSKFSSFLSATSWNSFLSHRQEKE